MHKYVYVSRGEKCWAKMNDPLFEIIIVGIFYALQKYDCIGGKWIFVIKLLSLKLANRRNFSQDNNLTVNLNR